MNGTSMLRPTHGAPLAALLAVASLLVSTGSLTAQPAPETASPRLAAAAATQAMTRARLSVLGDAFTCADARFVSFRRSDAEPEIVEQWYVASQLWADAVLLADVRAPLAGWDPLETRCHIDKGFVFLDR